MNRIVLAVALAVSIQGCASVNRAEGQKLTCVPTHARVGETATFPQTRVEYRIVELHPNDPRCRGAWPVVAVVEPTSAAVREQARREEQAGRSRPHVSAKPTSAVSMRRKWRASVQAARGVGSGVIGRCRKAARSTVRRTGWVIASTPTANKKGLEAKRPREFRGYAIPREQRRPGVPGSAGRRRRAPFLAAPCVV
jgi:hypothetical protein